MRRSRTCLSRGLPCRVLFCRSVREAAQERARSAWCLCVRERERYNERSRHEYSFRVRRGRKTGRGEHGKEPKGAGNCGSDKYAQHTQTRVGVSGRAESRHRWRESTRERERERKRGRRGKQEFTMAGLIAGSKKKARRVFLESRWECRNCREGAGVRVGGREDSRSLRQ